MKKVLFVSLLAFSFVSMAKAETATAKIAATSYVSSAIETRVSADSVLKNGTSVVSNSGFVADVNITGTGLDKKITLTKKPIIETTSGSGNVISDVSVNTSTNQIQVTKSRVQIPVGSQTSSTYTPIWVE